MRTSQQIQRMCVRGSQWRLCLATVLAVISLVATASGASELSAAHEISIRSQSLDTALQELTRQSGSQLVYRSRLVKGRQAPALQGRYTTIAALDVMLASSDLTYRVLSDDTIEVRRASLRQERRRDDALTHAPGRAAEDRMER